MSMLRGALLAVVGAAALLPAGTGAASPSATTTVSCAQTWSSFNVQLIGDRDWGWNFDGLVEIDVPAKKSMIIVWSMGGTIRGGVNPYAWATAARAGTSPKCRVVKATLRPASMTGLGPPIRVEDGWAFGRKFACLHRGRLLITTTRRAAGTKVVVRMQSNGKVIAVGEVGKGVGWIRGSTSCDDREK